MFARYYSTAFGLGYGIVMARILGPEEFGLMALAAFFLGLSTRIREFSLDDVLIQRPATDKDIYSTHWTMQLALGGFQLALVLLALPILNHFYPDVRVRNATLTGILLVLVLGDTMTIAASTPFALLRKKMRFGHLGIIEVAGATLTACSGIWLAAAGYGVWGLAVGRVAPAFLKLVYCWVMHPWKLSFKFNRQTARVFLKLGFFLWVIRQRYT